MVKLTTRQEVFWRHYVLTNSVTEAGRAAGYSKSYINSQLSKLLKLPQIKARIKKHQKSMQEDFETDSKELSKELRGPAFFDPADIFNDDGSIKAIKDIPKEARKVISSIKVKQYYEGYAEDKEAVGEIIEIKFINKLGAIDLLAKNIGFYEADNDQKERRQPIIINFADIQVGVKPERKKK